MTADIAGKYGPWALVVGASDGCGDGPTLMVGDMMRMAEGVFKTLSRNDAVRMFIRAGAEVMGSHDAGAAGGHQT